MPRDEQPRLVFPDTTAIINFALVDEMRLLERLVGAQRGCPAEVRDAQRFAQWVRRPS